MSTCNFQTARSLLILRAITGNIDRPGGDVMWVPPLDIKQTSGFMNASASGTEFLPKEMQSRRLDHGKYKLCGLIHPPAYWRSIISGEPYRVRAMWIVGSNALVAMTNSLEIKKALELLEFTVMSEMFMTPTAQMADLVLPANTWLEQDDIVNMHKIWCVLARKKVAQVGEGLDDREVMIQVARRLGLTRAFPWKDYNDYLAWVLEDTGMSFDEFCERGILTGDMKYYKYRQDGFNTKSGKFQIYSEALHDMGVEPLPVYREPPLTPVSAPEIAAQYPLILTTGAKIKGFFHSEGRQIKSLRKLNPDPLVEIHPETAAKLQIGEGDWVWIETQENRVKMRARLFDGILKDVVSAQHSWWFPEAPPPDYNWMQSSINLLFGDMPYDPDTGSEPLRSALCKVYPA